MASDKSIRTSIICALLSLLCCFTPALAVALASMGVASWSGVVNFVLFPLLALFLAMIGYAIYRRRSRV